MTDMITKESFKDLPMPSPSDNDLTNPIFNAIWEVTKTWDVNAPEYYEGYCGLNGSHVKIILDAISPLLDKAEKIQVEPVGEYVVNLEQWLIENMPTGTVIGDPKWWANKIHNVIAFTSPPNQSAKIAELEAEIARLKAITLMLLKSPS